MRDVSDAGHFIEDGGLQQSLRTAVDDLLSRRDKIFLEEVEVRVAYINFLTACVGVGARRGEVGAALGSYGGVRVVLESDGSRGSSDGGSGDAVAVCQFGACDRRSVVESRQEVGDVVGGRGEECREVSDGVRGSGSAGSVCVREPGLRRVPSVGRDDLGVSSVVREGVGQRGGVLRARGGAFCRGRVRSGSGVGLSRGGVGGLGTDLVGDGPERVRSTVDGSRSAGSASGSTGVVRSVGVPTLPTASGVGVGGVGGSAGAGASATCGAIRGAVGGESSSGGVGPCGGPGVGSSALPLSTTGAVVVDTVVRGRNWKKNRASRLARKKFRAPVGEVSKSVTGSKGSLSLYEAIGEDLGRSLRETQAKALLAENELRQRRAEVAVSRMKEGSTSGLVSELVRVARAKKVVRGAFTGDDGVGEWVDQVIDRQLESLTASSGEASVVVAGESGSSGDSLLLAKATATYGLQVCPMNDVETEVVKHGPVTENELVLERYRLKRRLSVDDILVSPAFHLEEQLRFKLAWMPGKRGNRYRYEYED